MPIKTSSRNISAYFDDDVSEEDSTAAMKFHEGEQNLLDFHRGNVADPLVNEDGSRTTIYMMGINVGDKVYAIPGYDPETRKIMSVQEAAEKWMPIIQNDPDFFPSHSSGEEHNKWAEEFHKIIEKTYD